jgi:hypothetical protein
MTRSRWPFLIVVVLGGALWANVSMAQMTSTPTDHSLHVVGANDAQVTTSSPSWTGSWDLGLFGLRLQSWGRASTRSWSGRTPAAVLRERLGLVR